MNVRLFVLGLLREQPRHGYELYRWLERSQTAVWAEVLPGSIYHALRQMHKEGLIDIQSTEQTGNRSRAIYTITPAGQAAFNQLLQEGWQHPPHSFPVRLYTLLTFSEHLPAPVLRNAIEHQLTALEQELARWQQGETAKVQAGVLPLWGQAMFENGKHHLEADIALLRNVLALIPAESF